MIIVIGGLHIVDGDYHVLCDKERRHGHPNTSLEILLVVLI
jgi:hypothetical protein